MKKTTRLKQLFNCGEIFTIAGGACALHARIAEVAGFECAYMSGGTTSAMIYGIPDAGLITMTEMIENAERMANCISIPLISDADQGFGGAMNTRRTVQSFIRAGVAGIHLEDQPLTRKCGFVKGKEVIPVEEAVAKYRAAVDAKNELDEDFVIIARCDARTVAGGSLKDVITRLKAYREAGVDVLYPEALQNLDEVREVRAALEGPIIATLLNFKPTPSLAELQKLGFAAAFHAGMIGLKSIEYAYQYAMDFRERDVLAEQEWDNRPKKYPFKDVFGMFDLVGFPEHVQIEQKYLTESAKANYDGSIGGYDPLNNK